MNEEEEFYDPVEYFADQKAGLHPYTVVQFLFVSTLGALVFGLAWGLIAIATASEFQMAAVLLGALMGYIASLFMRQSHAVIFPMWNSMMAIAGFLLGRYFIYMHFVLEEYAELGGESIGILELMRYYLLELGPTHFGVFLSDLPQIDPFWDFFMFVTMVCSVWIISFYKFKRDNSKEDRWNRVFKRRFS